MVLNKQKSCENIIHEIPLNYSVNLIKKFVGKTTFS